MKIARVRAPGQERTDLIDDARRVRDLSGHVETIDGDALRARHPAICHS